MDMAAWRRHTWLFTFLAGLCGVAALAACTKTVFVPTQSQGEQVKPDCPQPTIQAEYAAANAKWSEIVAEDQKNTKNASTMENGAAVYSAATLENTVWVCCSFS